MARLMLEVDERVYAMLKEAAQVNQLTLEQECLRRLGGGERHSRYVQALVAEMRAEDEQRRVDGSHG
ncbi:hypothetical protein [Pseudomonas sp. dw_358]|uniref:hypothetical protein n=1 Tax=Pseudomonas sp. dw_358 TaxID=2720083 RepID=UPI001BD34FB8|nr:hypothetical protein [Pseudomonas sp. dw_358]